MAVEFDLPEGIEAPDFGEAFVDGRYSTEKDNEVHEAFLARLREWLGINYPDGGDLAGEIIRFQVADGYAQYMVAREKPLWLLHLPIHDAWTIPAAHLRGLQLSDVRQQVESGRRLDALFARKKGS